MLKRLHIPQLFVVILAYFALWFLVPKAAFFPAIIRLIIHTMPHASKFARPILYICAIGVLSLPTIAFMAVQVAIVYFYAKIQFKWWQVLLAFAGLLICIIGFFAISAKLATHKPVPVGTLLTLRLFISFCTMLAAGSIGYLVALRIRDKNMLLPVSMFAAAIDCWTVAMGPVSEMIKRSPKVVEAVSAPIPQAGAGGFIPLTMIGPGDFLFMTLFFAAMWRLGMKARRNYWCVFAMMTLGMLAVMFGIVENLPALTVLAVAIVGANWREFKLSRQEAISVAIVGLILAISVPLVWSVFRPAHRTSHEKPKTSVTTPQRAHSEHK